jgi:DNA-directed RNA polymerase specialized sigma24 family protein
MLDANFRVLEEQYWKTIADRNFAEEARQEAFEQLLRLPNGRWGKGRLEAVARATVVAAVRDVLKSKDVDLVDWEGIADEVLVTIYLKAGTIRSLRAWMKKAARNLVLREIAGRRLWFDELERSALLAPVEGDEEAEREREVEAARTDGELLSRFAGLTPAIKEVAHLYLHERLERAQICDRLGITPATLRKRIERLQDVLDPDRDAASKPKR